MTPTLLRRLGSLLYEALVAIAIVLVAVSIFSLVTTAAPGLPRQRPMLLALCFATLGAYFIYCWRHGQTLAMRAWKIRIVDGQGQPPGLGRACIRYLLSWVWLVPPLALTALLIPHESTITAALSMGAGAVAAWVAIWSLASLLLPGKQFLHDTLAGTRLILARG